MIPAFLLAALASAGAPGDFAKAGGFAIQQVATADAAGLVRDFANPGRASAASLIDEIGREQVVDSFIVFSGCRPDLVRRCNVTADFMLIGPQGQEYARHEGADIWVGKPAPGQDTLTLSTSSLGVYIEPEDPAGTYIVRAAVTDHNAGVTLTTEKPLRLIEPR